MARIGEMPRRWMRAYMFPVMRAGPLTMLITLIALVATVCLTSAAAAQPLRTAVTDPETFVRSDTNVAFTHVRAAGATAVRLALPWSGVAPGGSSRPAFDASNPEDPAYNWTEFDRQVRLADARGLDVIAVIVDAPPWAHAGTADEHNFYPKPEELKAFSQAAARRYSGSFGSLPRVRYWSPWNEPNKLEFLAPQFVGDTFVAPGLYRDLLNAGAQGVKSVRGDNLVIAGELDPMAATFGPGLRASPVALARSLLCMSGGRTPRSVCNTSVTFDVWASHPYTSGGPTHRANPGNASLGDLPDTRRLIEAAVRAGHVVHSAPVQLWVTEFSWDTNPPDPGAVPAKLHTRWTAEALYRMWKAGTSLVTWFSIRDSVRNGLAYRKTFQSGLYFRGPTLAQDKPKPSQQAYRFPFVAFPSRSRIHVWGRVPPGAGGKVAVEQQAGRRWKRLVRLRTDGSGIFEGRIRSRGRGVLRARTSSGEKSPRFSLVQSPDRPFHTFG